MSQYEFTLPDVGEGLDKGVVLAWRVAAGDTVKADQIIAEVETDKAVVEIPAPVNGVVIRLGTPAGGTLAVGEILAVFETEATTPREQPAERTAPPPSPSRSAATAGDPGATSRSLGERKGRVKASPATRKRARAAGIDLATIAPTGSRGQVTRGDLEQGLGSRGTVSGATPPPRREAVPGAGPGITPGGEDVVEPLSGLRRQIALNMEQAWRTVPHIFTLEEIEATELVKAREALNEELSGAGRRLSYLPFFVKACVAALQSHPRFNATIDMDNERVIYHARCNIGIATATPDGLIVTVVHDADTKSLTSIAQEIEALAGLARERRVTVEQIRGSTFTISNYGSYGAWMGTPIVRPPEVAIAGFGRIHEAVIPVDGVAAVRTMLPMVVSTDHRLNDGEHLGAFLQTLSQYLRAPVRLLAR